MFFQHLRLFFVVFTNNNKRYVIFYDDWAGPVPSLYMRGPYGRTSVPRGLPGILVV